MSEFWKGIALPFGTTIPSVFDPKGDSNILATSIQMIVLTQLGERVMQPEFGCDLLSMLFDPADVTTVNEVQQRIQDAITRWDDRIRLENVVANISQEENRVDLVVTFSVIKSGDRSTVYTTQLNLTPEMLQGGIISE